MQHPPKGRGATANPPPRFLSGSSEVIDDGWAPSDEPPPPLATTVTVEQARSILSRNDSPDIPFSLSLNPYRGCEHGCIYCYARPSHAYMDLSPGLDFESRLFAKPNAAELLRRELAKPGYRCSPIALGSNTDPYQPIEREWRLTRQVLEVLAEYDHPVTITTKSSLVERDIDILAAMSEKNLTLVFVSLPTLDRGLARAMEPRATAPQRRLETLRRLREAGIPCGVLAAPMIPQLNDRELETVLEAAREAGAEMAAYTLLRLPYELKELFRDWLARHYPLRAEHVLSLLRQMRQGQENDSRFGQRMRGSGQFAELIRSRFRLALKRLGYNRRELLLDTEAFRPPLKDGQLNLF
jgi:DNA repair photolyase